jgi:hypothetical protein
MTGIAVSPLGHNQSSGAEGFASVVKSACQTRSPVSASSAKIWLSLPPTITSCRSPRVTMTAGVSPARTCGVFGSIVFHRRRIPETLAGDSVCSPRFQPVR